MFATSKLSKKKTVARSVSKDLPPSPWEGVREKLEAQRQEKLKDNVNALVAIAQTDTEYLSVVWKECTDAMSKFVDSHKQAFDKRAEKRDAHTALTGRK